MDGLFTFLIVALLITWLVLFIYFEHYDTNVVQKPVLLMAFQTRRKPMSDLLTYQVTVGAPVDHDVVARQLSITVDGVSEGTRSYEGGTTDLGTFEASQDANVVLTLIDVDDAGNYSEPAVLSFVASDTLRPSTPGAFNVILVSERSGDVPAPPAEPTGPSADATEN